MIIYCVGCEHDVDALLCTGKEMYPHREDLWHIPFWKCPDCPAFVGCHWKTKNRTKPLGVLATKEMKDARKKIHAVLDPLWKRGLIKRGKAYAHIRRQLGYEYHTGELRTLDEARIVYRIVADLHNQLIYERNTKKPV